MRAGLLCLLHTEPEQQRECRVAASQSLGAESGWRDRLEAAPSPTSGSNEGCAKIGSIRGGGNARRIVSVRGGSAIYVWGLDEAGAAGQETRQSGAAAKAH